MATTNVNLNNALGEIQVSPEGFFTVFFTSSPSSISLSSGNFNSEQVKSGTAKNELLKAAKRSAQNITFTIKNLNDKIAKETAIANDPNENNIARQGAKERLKDYEQDKAKYTNDLAGAQATVQYIENQWQSQADGLIPAPTAQGPANAAPATAVAATTTPTKNNLTGSADGDNKKDAVAGQNQPTVTANATPTTTSGQQGGGSVSPATAPASNKQVEKPGKRTYNPLSQFPTYTYNITLYMLTPTAYDAFVKSGRTNLDLSPTGGVVTVCQSGGIDSNTQTRAPGFALDYYIDNLKIITATSGKDTDSATNTTEITFTITEPYGFSFISNLKRAADDLIAKTQAKGVQDLGNPIRQFFMLGIRFTGFNSDGTPISTKEEPLYERFYDIMLTKMSFRLENRATQYNITAASIAPGTAFGVKRGVWDTGGTLRGSNVYEMLKDMCSQMNKQAEELVKGKNIKPNKFSFKFMGDGVGESEAEQKRTTLFGSPMKTQTEIDKSKLVNNSPKTTDQTQVKRDQGKPNENARELVIPKGTPILQAFQLIISRSSYIEDAFKVLQTNALENNPKNPKKDVNKTTGAKETIKWYNVSAECTNATYNKDIADFTWDIKYIFRTYETPVVDNPYSNLGVDYYGPHKRYQYWYTGKNSEIISYSQTLDNTYFTVALLAPEQENPSGTATPPVATSTGKAPDVAKTDQVNQQGQAKNTYLSSLFDPGAYANATLKIMGDPDFLMPESTSSINDVYSQFYGSDGFTVSPNGGQVFIEIDFKEGQDYGFKTDDGIMYKPTGDGLMSMNDKIQFWQYPTEIQEIVEGVSYQVIRCTSSFSNGKFEQDLQLSINQFPGYEAKPERLEEVQVTGRRVENAAPATTAATPQQTGLKVDPVAPSSTGNLVNAPASQTSSNGGQAATVPTKTGPVANDDSTLEEVKITARKVVEPEGRDTLEEITITSRRNNNNPGGGG